MEGGKGKERRREDGREKGKEEVGRVTSENGKRRTLTSSSPVSAN